jgi:hypothetical protein
MREAPASYDPPKLVVVTPIVSVALWPLPPTIVNEQLPAATGVTLNAVPLAGEIVAIPPHVVVEAVNVPV